MIKTKYMFSEAKAKDLAPKAKAKDMTSCPRGQGYGLEDSISENDSFVYSLASLLTVAQFSIARSPCDSTAVLLVA